MAPFDAKSVGRSPGVALELLGYRNQPPGFNPRSGEGARRNGGRFNAPHSFPVIYLCTTRPCVVAEFARQVERQGVTIDGFLPRELYQLSASLTKVLDLTMAETLATLGLSTEDLLRDDRTVPHEIGEAAHAHGFQAIRCPSATGVDDVVALMPENLAGAVLGVELLEEWLDEKDVQL